jgi:hypothetical protein
VARRRRTQSALRSADSVTISFLGDRATQTRFAGDQDGGERRTMVVHAGGGLVVFLAASALAIFKPSGRTRYGWRKLRAES